MTKPWLNGKLLAATVAAAGIYGLTPSKAQTLAVDHAECTYFGPERERFMPRAKTGGFEAGRLTRQFQTASIRNSASNAGRAKPFAAAVTGKSNLIDQFIYADLQANNIVPAGKTNDYEFIRRVSLDLTGRIPTGDRLGAFINSIDPNKRAALIDELLAAPEWVDKL